MLRNTTDDQVRRRDFLFIVRFHRQGALALNLHKGRLSYRGKIGNPSCKLGKVGLNFDFLLSKAQGQWIVLSDQDDQWLPGRLDVLSEIPDDAQVVLCDAEVVDQDGSLLTPSLLSAHGMRRGVRANLIHNCYTGCCLAIRRR